MTILAISTEQNLLLTYYDYLIHLDWKKNDIILYSVLHYSMGILVLAYISFYYRKTPNKRPWAFVSLIVSKRAFLAFSSFLRNANRTIFAWDRVKNVKKDQFWALGGGGPFIGRGRLLGVLRYIIFIITVMEMSSIRGGSLPEIWNNLPDGGRFSWVPVLLQIQVKFLFLIHVFFII